LNGKLNPLTGLGDGEEVKNKCKQFASNEYRLFVLSYEGFYRFVDVLDRKCDLIVFDEGHRLKNKNSKVYKKLFNFTCRKRVLLTGTPLQNNLDELYTCISMVNPNLFPSEQTFKNIFQKPIFNGMAKNASQRERTIAIERTLELANRIK
jgi:DNA repair and recombination RAD54-like protein